MEGSAASFGSQPNFHRIIVFDRQSGPENCPLGLVDQAVVNGVQRQLQPVGDA